MRTHHLPPVALPVQTDSSEVASADTGPAVPAVEVKATPDEVARMAPRASVVSVPVPPRTQVEQAVSAFPKSRAYPGALLSTRAPSDTHVSGVRQAFATTFEQALSKPIQNTDDYVQVLKAITPALNEGVSDALEQQFKVQTRIASASSVEYAALAEVAQTRGAAFSAFAPLFYKAAVGAYVMMRVAAHHLDSGDSATATQLMKDFTPEMQSSIKEQAELFGAIPEGMAPYLLAKLERATSEVDVLLAKY